MRAAASRDCVLARSWQSQRVTRRSLGVFGPFDPESVDGAGDGAVFQPVPSHSGQTSAETFINPGTLFNEISSFDFAPEADLAQVLINGPLCTSCAGAAPLVEGRGKTGEEGCTCAGEGARPHCQTSRADRRSGPIPVKNGSRSANAALPSAKSAFGADFHNLQSVPAEGN